MIRGRRSGEVVVKFNRRIRVRTFLRTTELLILVAFAWHVCIRKLHITHFIPHTPLYNTVSHNSIRLRYGIMARFSSILMVLSAWFISSSAQFGFFDQMFGNQGHQQQQPQNVRSDSSWYQAQYEGGTYIAPPSYPIQFHSP